LDSELDAGIVESEDLATEEVVAGRDVRWDGNIHLPIIRDHSVRRPQSGRSVVSVFKDLEPHVAFARFGECEVVLDGTLVGGIEDVIRRCVRVVVPLNADSRTS
jgi:hypothetical protein